MKGVSCKKLLIASNPFFISCDLCLMYLQFTHYPGWTAVKVILGMKTIHEAIENDLLKIVAVTFRKTK